MDSVDVNRLVTDLLIVLATGFVAGALCKRVGLSLLVGYMVVGALIGQGGLSWVSQENHELEYLARTGALLLLFSVGIEFSLEELVRLRRFIFVGGAAQMLLVAVPATVAAILLGMSWQAALLVAAAVALSSTVLVFKALSEWGQTATPHGRRAVGVLLFQDAAFVPLMLVVPLLTGVGDRPSWETFAWLLGKSALLVAGVLLARRAITTWAVPLLAGLRSVELVVLFTLTVLGGACWSCYAIGLPPALGALAAGLMLSGNRLSQQIDTLVLPYRETFAAVFFVTLGTLLQPLAFFDEPLALTFGLIGILALKALAAAGALRLTGLGMASALGMGVGLAQLGEFSFLLIAEGVRQDVISREVYNRLLFIAMGTLIATPQLLKLGLRWTQPESADQHGDDIDASLSVAEPIQHALLIGIGPIARQIASRLEILGVDVCLVDLSPVNLHPFAQQGFHTVAGDAREPEALRRAGALNCRLAVVCVPEDEASNQIVRALRELNSAIHIVVRCRYLANVAAARQAGAEAVVSEERLASQALLDLCDEIVRRAGREYEKTN